jgi:hypothetical protein
MRGLGRVVVVTCLVLGTGGIAGAVPYEERSAAQRAGYTALAAIMNVVPVAPAPVAPRCLPGYILCKAFFAGFSVVAAGEQLVLSGGSDLPQTRAILHRGFAGDWLITGRHVAGDAEPDLLPEPAPARPEAGSGLP